MKLRIDRSLLAAFATLLLLSAAAFTLLFCAARQETAVGAAGAGGSPAGAPRKKKAAGQALPAQAPAADSSCTVTFVAQGLAPYRKTVTAGGSYGALPLPELHGYTFGGWYTGEEGRGRPVSAGTAVSVSYDHKLYGLWHKNPLITFDPNGGSIGGKATQLVSYGSPVALERAESMVVSHAKPDKAALADFALIGGYTFSGWSTKSDGSGSFYRNGALITLTSDITLYAQWSSFLRSSSVQDRPQLVTLTRPFYLCSHEVTQAEYERFCFYGSKAPSLSYGRGETVPAYYVSWYDAVIYCNLRSLAEGLEPVYSIGWQKDPRRWKGVRRDEGGRLCASDVSSELAAFGTLEADFDADGYRLPTEAEWQYAALGSYAGKGWGGYDEAAYAGYDGSEARPQAFVWSSENSRSRAHPVKEKEPNSYGLYDMSGNVWEWCYDRASEYTTAPAVNPVGALEGGTRILRGGSCAARWDACRITNRSYMPGKNFKGTFGLRLAL